MISFSKPLLLLVAVVASFAGAFEHYGAEQEGSVDASGLRGSEQQQQDRELTGCPTMEGIPDTCLDSVLPPWPICLYSSVEGFIIKSKDSYKRCCEGDGSACKCPVKDGEKFLSRIDDWCAGILTCPDL